MAEPLGFLTRLGLSMTSDSLGEGNVLRNAGFAPIPTASGAKGFIPQDMADLLEQITSITDEEKANMTPGQFRAVQRDLARVNASVQPVDPEGFDFPGDIADFGGDALVSGASVLGGMQGFKAGAGVGTAAWPGPGTIIGGVTGAMVGAPTGAGIGEVARQNIGNTFFGADRPWNQRRFNEELVLGAAGEVVGPFFSRIIGRVLKPLRGATQRTGQVVEQGKAFDEEFGTNLAERLPLEAQTESRGIARMAQLTSESPITQGKMLEKVTKPFREEVDKLFQQVRQQGGFDGATSKEEVGDLLSTGVSKTIEVRRDAVDGLYTALREKLPENIEVLPVNTQEALGRIAERTGADALEGFDIAKGTRGLLASLGEDVEKITTFEQLDAFRKRVGSMLNSRGAQEEFARVGMDKQIGDLYGALVRDAEAVLSFEGTEGLAKQASASARNMFDLDRSSAASLFNDPDKLATATNRLFNKNSTPQFVRRFKEKLGAASTEAGLPGTEEGQQAWQAVGQQLMDRIRTAAQAGPQDFPGQPPIISGDRMISELDRMGGQEILTEVFGDKLTKDLYKAGEFLRNANVSERGFANTSRTAESGNVASLLRDLFSGTRRGLFSAVGGSLARRGAAGFLTNPTLKRAAVEGIGQGPFMQLSQRAAGRGLGQEAVRWLNDLGNGRNVTVATETATSLLQQTPREILDQLLEAARPRTPRPEGDTFDAATSLQNLPASAAGAGAGLIEEFDLGNTAQQGADFAQKIGGLASERGGCHQGAGYGG